MPVQLHANKPLNTRVAEQGGGLPSGSRLVTHLLAMRACFAALMQHAAQSMARIHACTTALEAGEPLY